MQFDLKTLLQRLPVLHTEGETALTVTAIVAMGDAATVRTSLFWCSDKNREQLLTTERGIVLVSRESFDFLRLEQRVESADLTWIVVEKPRQAFMQLLQLVQEGNIRRGVIAASARIDPSAVMDAESISVGENVVIEADVRIGKQVVIDHNTVIKAGTVIGDHVHIGANCTIGGVGFGYEPNDEGTYELIPHIGNVVLNNHVEVGNNTCIDRAVLGSTVVGESAKIDNLVHIAHGVQIGRNSLIIANAMIAGSVKIGENCWIAPSVSVIQKTTVGNDTIVGLGSVVIRDVEAHAVYTGVPAKKLRDK